MTRAVLVVAGGVLALGATPTPPVFPTQIGLVVVQATVRNGRGEPVTDLARDAFALYENGRRQSITMFEHGDAPVSLGVVLDDSRSMHGRRDAAEAAAMAALAAAREADEVFVMSFADKARLDVPFTSDRDRLAAGVSRRQSVGGTALRDAVAQAVEELAAQAARPRRVLLVVSDGNDNASAASPESVERAATDAGVAVFAIGITSPDEDAARRGRDALSELAESTGGAARFAADAAQADAAGREAARLMRHFYTIGYAPLDQALDGTYRTLRVTAKGRERLWVRTRPGYRAAPGHVGRPHAD